MDIYKIPTITIPDVPGELASSVNINPLVTSNELLSNTVDTIADKHTRQNVRPNLSDAQNPLVLV